MHQLPGRRVALLSFRLTSNDPDATEELIRLATTIPNHLCALFAKSYSEAIVPVARSYANFGGGVGLWERVEGWYAEAF